MGESVGESMGAGLEVVGRGVFGVGFRVVGERVGSSVGDNVGVIIGNNVGVTVGASVGCLLGGAHVGYSVRSGVG